MRTLGLAFLLLIAAAPALAQTGTAGKPAAPKRAPPPSVQQTYAAMPLNERIAIQTDLVWVGDYNGIIDGDFNARTIEAVKAFQRRNRSKETGVLNLQERALLAGAAKTKRDFVGWRIITDPATGARLGLPGKLVQPVAAPKDGNKNPNRNGSRWSSAQGQIQVETFRIAEPGTTLPAVFEREKKEPSERKVEYQVQKGDFFVVSGTQNLKKFYVRAHIKEGEVRGMRVLYDPANEVIMDPVAIAMSSAFAPFPEGGQAPRRIVEYGTGVVVGSGGEIITDREVSDGCQVITVAGIGNADRIDDKDSGLALLQLYGVRNLKPIALAAATPDQGAVTIVGIADPQAQGGGAAASSAAAQIGHAGDARTVEPAPGPGFSGAAIVDAQRRLVGLVTLKPSVVAGAAPPRPQAEAIPVEAIRKYLQARHVALAEQSDADPKASVVRVICVRK